MTRAIFAALSASDKGAERVSAGHNQPMSQPVNKPVLFGALALHAVFVALTWRDIQSRPTERIRGAKTGWRIASAVNTIGSLAYWTVGRR
jgi:hypothetical protein